ncbi:cysteine-tRNA ligase [Vavraia culicis subsp. floridensis]|uniref:cysteine--tRNA ligase n=1 Tax=Vavraia culicis (isolate floridensis) TaxID=948595 RepID=L2GUF9_VAVCU|nr:cysteine-tRNA ligase [Vavraia culicis subsp. floridensis]ELA47306.1 cysteine-tRNA ligase [Vavraia culicis subsp. floridensis]
MTESANTAKQSLHIKNTLTNTVEPFTPITPSQIKMYICGPTVYDSAHLGHARTYICFDVIRRILEEHFHYDVTFVMNITNIDDKIVKKAEAIFSEFLKSNVKYVNADSLGQEQKRNAFVECVEFVTRKYEEEFFEDMRRLNVKMPSFVTKVTDYMGEIIQFVEKLVEKGRAYVSNGSVYFDMVKFVEEGGQRHFRDDDAVINEAEEGSEKRHRTDFALWKRCKEGDLYYFKSPWSNGRPGWHIECSAMGMDVLGLTMDIHAGGIDLQFPHHENELIQSRALTDRQYVNYFMHTGHLHIEGLKMSKSLKNFITIQDCLKKFTARQIRVMFLNNCYDSTVTYRYEAMEYAEKIEKKLFNFVSMAEAEIAGRERFAGDKAETSNADSAHNTTDTSGVDGRVQRSTNMERSVTRVEQEQTHKTEIVIDNGEGGEYDNRPLTDDDDVVYRDESTEEDANDRTDQVNNTAKDPYYVINKRMYGPLDQNDRMVLRMLEIAKKEVHESFCDNFNTYKTLTAILNLVTIMHQKMYNCSGQIVQLVLDYIKKILSMLGLEAKQEMEESMLPNIICNFRSEVRRLCKEKKGAQELFHACDVVRDEMVDAGYVIEDKGSESVIRKKQ